MILIRKLRDFFSRYAGYRYFIWVIVKKEFKIRYAQSYLNMAWAIFEPFILVMTLSVAFSVMTVRLAPDNIPYPLFFYAALLPYNLLRDSLTRGSQTFIKDRALLLKVLYPRSISIFSQIVVFFIDYFFANVAFSALLLYYGFLPNVHYVYLPMLLASLAVLMAGLMLIIASINVYIRDIRVMAPLFSTMLFWFTPIIVLFPDEGPGRLVYRLNPLAGVVTAFREIILYNRPPVWEQLASIFIIGPAVFILGCAVYRRLQRNFVDVI